MATVKIETFGGIMPRVHPSLLRDGMAVDARNMRFKNGKAVPIRQPSEMLPEDHTLYCENGMGEIAEAQSVFCWKHTMKDGTVRTDFLAFPGDVQFARGSETTDEYDRVYVSGDTGIGFTDRRGVSYENTPAVYLFDRESGEIVRRTILKDAPFALNGELEDKSSVSDTNFEYVGFYMTWSDRFGYESPIATEFYARNEEGGAFSNEELLKIPGSGGVVAFQPVSVKPEAEYMTLYANSGNGFMAVRKYARDELNGFVNGFKFNLKDLEYGEETDNIQAPPADLRNVTYVPGGFYAGTSPSDPHTVLFSARKRPASWPLAYRYGIKDNVVKVAVTANSVFALTDGTPYVLSGTAPGAMTTASLASAAACVSVRGVCVYRNAVFFASNYGLFTVSDSATSSTSCTCITESYFTKDQWQLLNPESCIMGAYDGALHLFFTARNGRYPDDAPAFMAGKSHVGMIVDLTESPFAITTHDEVATCICTDDTTDDLYFVRDTTEVA